MYAIEDSKGKRYYFFSKTDADNYCDYLLNGLKIIKQKNKNFLFNNGDWVIDVTTTDESEKRYVLETRRGRKINSAKLQKKHIAVINEYMENT